MTQPFGAKYPIVIPSLTENADIQTALKVYHYGESTEPSTLNSNSIAGHLNTLENTKVDIIPQQITAGSDNNLNLKVTTGYYSAATNAIASAGTFYPSGATAGILHVINDGSGIIYQTYISNASKFYWRGYYSGAWTTWKETADTGYIPESVGTRLTNLEASVATKQATITGGATTIVDTNLDTNKVLVSDGSGKVRASADITTTELGYLNGATSSVNTTVLGNKSSGVPVPPGIKRIVIARDNGSTAPDATITPVEGDLWFW